MMVMTDKKLMALNPPFGRQNLPRDSPLERRTYVTVVSDMRKIWENCSTDFGVGEDIWEKQVG